MAINYSAFGPILFLFSLLPQSTLQNQYCAITSQHTLCKFQGVGPKCKTPYEIGIPREDRELIMEMHNSFRSLVATGNEKRGRPGPQPSSSNMKQLVWDDELAETAQRLADQCKYTHDCFDCRKVSRFLTGQNLYQFSENILRPKSNWAQAINAWYDEVAQWSPNHIQPFHFIKPLGHYTQMLWADTDRMGCGYSYFNDGKWNRKLYICNYGSAGNIITTEMYARGTPCSQCPQEMTCSTTYPGLCVESTSSASNYPSPTIGRFKQPITLTTPQTTTTTTTTPSTNQLNNFNEIETNDLQFEFRSNFPKKPKTKEFGSLRIPSTTSPKPEVIQFVRTQSTITPTSSGTSPSPSQSHQRTIKEIGEPNKRLKTWQDSEMEWSTAQPRTNEKSDQRALATVSRQTDSLVSTVTDMNSILLYCDFDFAKCPIRFTGEGWNYTIEETEGFGRGFATIVPMNSLTNLYIRSIMFPQEDGNICLSFRYINYPEGRYSEGKGIPLKVTAGTLKQRPKIVELKERSKYPDDWLTARIQFQNLNSNFLLIFQLPRNRENGEILLALDDILVTQGLCP